MPRPRTIPSPGTPPSSKAGAKSCGVFRKASAHCTLKKHTSPISSRTSQVFDGKGFIETIQLLRTENRVGWFNYKALLESIEKPSLTLLSSLTNSSGANIAPRLDLK